MSNTLQVLKYLGDLIGLLVAVYGRKLLRVKLVGLLRGFLCKISKY